MREKFLPFSLPTFNQEEKDAISKVIDSGWVTTGPITNEFETKFSQYVGAKYAIAVSSCTAALHLSLAALGVKAGDWVITTPFTFAATANVILHLGAKPLFVDICADTFNVDPEKINSCLKKNIRSKRGKIKGIVVVHYAGLPCQMDAILLTAKKFGFFVIEDAAHALGSEYKGKKIGAISDATCFSFYPTKLITTGEGGMVAVDKKNIANRIRILSSHGITKSSWKRYSKENQWKYKIIFPGFKYNMTDLQASIGICQLSKLDYFIEKRREYCSIYDNFFKNLKEVCIPAEDSNVFHSRHIYPILLNTQFLRINRDEFMAKLKAMNIGTSVHFIPLHLHPVYKKLGYKKGDFPVCEHIYRRILSLPLFPAMTRSDIDDVVNAVSQIIKNNKK
jgi:dTDP-4-amino-4,6-dideoxygalactose transaminase